MQKKRAKVFLAAIGSVTLFAVSIIGTRIIGMRYAEYKTEELLAYSCSDIPNTLRAIRRSAFAYDEEKISARINVANPPSAEEMRDFVDGCIFDELHLVNRYGRVLASSDPALKGRDLTSIPSMMEFLLLADFPDHIVKQPIRLSISDSKTEVSYCAFPQADGALLLCGIIVDRLRKNLVNSCNDLLSFWSIGETGAYAVVDEHTGKFVFDIGDRRLIGKPFAEVGDPAALTVDLDVDTSHTGMIFGRLCHYRAFDCYGLRIIAYVAHDEFYAPVASTTLAVATVLLLAFVVFGTVFHRVTLANRAIARMREAEDRQRMKDMVMATSIQKNSLPTTFPPYPNLIGIFDIYAFMQAAKAVGGDFYDFYFVGKNKVALVIADVSGKGVPAAMFMMRAKTTLQGLLKGGTGLVDAMAKSNDRLCEGNPEDMFVTAWAGVCDLSTGEVEYVNAGHNPPLIHRADGSVEWIRPRSGLALAAVAGATYRLHRLKLGPGDGLVLYTDGVTEAQNAGGALYGENRLERNTAEVDADLNARGYCDRILSSISAFAGNTEQSDDITMLGFRLKSLVRPAPIATPPT